MVVYPVVLHVFFQQGLGQAQQRFRMKYNLNSSFNSVTVDILDRSVNYASVPQLSSEVTIVHLTHRENK